MNFHEWYRFEKPSEPLFDRFLEILRHFEPNTPLVSGLVTCDPRRYRCYIACNKVSGKAEAVGIACYLPKSNVLHIEDFALDPSIHGRGLAKDLYQSWREFICSEWPEARLAGITTTMIEVYEYNVEKWNKIMQVDKVMVSQPAKFIRKDTPIVLMVRDLPCPAEMAYAEWQDYQVLFYRALGVPESKKRTGLVWHELFGWYNSGSISAGQFPAEISEVKGIYIQPGQHFDVDGTSRAHSLIKVCGAGDELYWMTPKPASKEQLALVHDLKHINRLESLNTTGGDAGEFTTFGSGGYEIARLAAGGVIQAIDDVVKGVVRNAYALVRPAGHHAEHDKGMGFCIFNSISIGARYARKCGLERVAILDWDAHHGNGTEKTFFADKSVLYISTHQDSVYPPRSGSVHDTGEGKGAGYTINIPLPPGTGEGGYDEAWKRLIIPAIDAFRPNIILVSSGFNASAMDPMSNMMLSSAAFVKFTEYLMILADRHCSGRLVLVHEGGYSAATVPYAVVSVIETLMERSHKTVDPYRKEIQGYGGHDCTIDQRTMIDVAIAKAKSHGVLIV
jgi:acetoin utilization deacetylase AcuC-like enzyme/GNAT superfamily N-acetyltransferase